MALVLKDRVRESSTSSGTGSITLAGAFTGYQTFNSVVASGSTVYYTIHNTTSPNDNEWEVGVGTFTSPSTLTRDTVFSSSAGGTTKVNFTGSSTLEVFITQPAEQAVYINDATGKVEVFGNGTNTVAFTAINATNLTANTVTLTAGTITTNAANATDITNKAYVDGLFSTGITYHDPVLVESPISLNALYNQPGGAGNGVGATLTNNGANVALVVDGVSLSNTARVLVYQQSNAAHNGAYTVTNAGAPDPGGAKWVLTRATDADTYGVGDPNKLGQGDAFFVQSGNTGAGETYILNTVGTITFGTTNLTFAQISSAQIYSAGTGLNLANLTFSLVTPVATTNGGTGLTSFTANAIPYASNTSALATGSALTFDGTNLSTTGQVISTKTGSATTGAGQVYLNGATSNRIDWAAVGTGAPAFTTRSDGTKLLLYPSISGSLTDYAIGIDAATMWSSVPENDGSFKFKWYGATTEIANLTGTGAFTATSFTGNGVALTAINASNITSGTISNARTTGSTSNSASTLVLRDANGSFGSNVISAASFSGDGTAITAINASNISSGTIANARTTAASANGASTIVQRDASGNFIANSGTFTSISGNGVALTAINASNIASGTIANARTTASSSNGASTIVLRGASGEFAAGAITGTSFSGNGSALTAINATAITTGTLDNARTNASSANGASTLVVRDANGSFAGNVITGTTGTFTSVSGNGVALTAINASNISSGTIANARTTASDANGASTIVSRDANGSFSANVITATTISGNGASLTNINASNISSGTLATGRISGSYTGITGVGTIAAGTWQANVITATYGGTNSSAAPTAGGIGYGNGSAILLTSAGTAGQVLTSNAASVPTWTTASSSNGASTIVQRDSNGSFSANVVTATSGSFTNVSGNGSALTAINASNISSGTIANARTSASDANGASTIVSRDANGSFSANIGTFNTISGNGASLTNINASNISSGTIANARTTAATANGASTIVLRGTSGEFSAGAITGASFTGDGSAISAINGSNVTTGTVANARTTAASANGASTIVARDANGSFSGNVVTGTTGTFTNISGNGSSLTAINASNVTSGTLDNARTSASSANGASTIVSRDANGSFTANVGTFTTVSGAHSGNGAGLTDINASNISSGTIANARTTAATANGASTIVLRDGAGNFAAGAISAVSFTGSGSGLTSIPNSATTATSANGASTIVARDVNGNFTANIVTATFSGNGSSVTDINASNITSGTISNARTTASASNGASTIVARDTSGNFTANAIITTTISGNGATLTDINASNISSGTVATARLGSGTANASTFLRGDQTYAVVATANDGTLTMNTSGTGISGSATFTANQSGNSTFTVTSNANSSNGASTIVLRGASGEFSAGAITGDSFTGNGSAISAINASNISSGTISNDRTTATAGNAGSTIVLRDGAGNFSAQTVSLSGGLGVSNGSNTSPTITNIFDSNTGIYFPAADTIAFTEGGVERMRIDSTGDVLIGTTATIPGAFSDTAKLQIAQNTGEAVLTTTAFVNGTGGSFVYLNKSRSGTIGTNTIVQSGDTLGVINFAGAAGTTYHRAADITVAVDGAPGTNDMPGRLVFSTTVDGATGPTERMRINNAGEVGIGATPVSGLRLVVDGTIASRSAGGEGGEFFVYNPDNTTTGMTFDVSTADNARIFSVRNNFALSIGQLGGTGGSIKFFTAGNERVTITSAGGIESRVSAGTPTLDVSPNTYTIANNGTVDFPNMAGILFQTGATTANVVMWFMNGGATSAISNVNGVTGTLAYVVGINGYRWTNNTGSSQSITFFTFRGRPNA